ncbi:MAG: arginine repressor [Gemmatimonadaceae bacterium]|nr:arginine repressor [Gemmatimonadaceae bacterium]MCW5827028.1 arginine repressor [Gemmatimonadaceae bacterium]
MTANKRERQHAILELIGSREIGSQEELRQLLLKHGWDVTQSTLSRDLRDLRVARVPSPQGVRYVIGEAGGGGDDGSRAPLAGILPQLFLSLDGVGPLLVLKTVIGGAQPVASAIDSESPNDILGTIAGDDTILMICRSEQARERVARRLSSLAKRAR